MIGFRISVTCLLIASLYCDVISQEIIVHLQSIEDNSSLNRNSLTIIGSEVDYSGLYRYETEARYLMPGFFQHHDKYSTSVPFFIEILDSLSLKYEFDKNLNGVIEDSERQVITEPTEIHQAIVFPTSDSSDTLIANMRIPINPKMNLNKITAYTRTCIEGQIESQDKTYHLFMSKFLGSPRVKIDDDWVNYGDPIPIGKTYYYIDDLDYINDEMTLKAADSSRVLGTSRGFFVDSQLEKVSSSIVGPSFGKPFTIYHFWGSWCHPCMEELPEISRLLNGVDTTKFDIINIALLRPKKGEQKANEIETNRKLTTKYYNQSIININEDGRSHNSIIRIMKNQPYPNIIITRADGMILYNGQFEQKPAADVIEALSKKE